MFSLLSYFNFNYIFNFLMKLLYITFIEFKLLIYSYLIKYYILMNIIYNWLYFVYLTFTYIYIYIDLVLNYTYIFYTYTIKTIIYNFNYEYSVYLYDFIYNIVFYNIIYILYYISSFFFLLITINIALLWILFYFNKFWFLKNLFQLCISTYNYIDISFYNFESKMNTKYGWVYRNINGYLYLLYLYLMYFKYHLLIYWFIYFFIFIWLDWTFSLIPIFESKFFLNWRRDFFTLLDLKELIKVICFFD